MFLKKYKLKEAILVCSKQKSLVELEGLVTDKAYYDKAISSAPFNALT